MKKSLSLIAILGLLLMVSNVFAVAPIFNDIPDLKFYVNQGLSAAFDLAQYNTGDAATSYSIAANGLGLTFLSGSTVGQNNYGSITVSNNSYLAANAGGSSLTTSNKAKYADYKIYKLPKVGLNVGSSFTVPVGTFTNNSSGLTVPASFGNASAIIISDTTKVSAVWSNGSTSVTITSLAAASGPVYVDVIASISSTNPAGSNNQDKERIEVNSNLIAGSSFGTSADTANYGFEVVSGRTTLAAISYSAGTVTAGGGTIGVGVLTLTATDGQNGAKVTLVPGSYISISGGNWYTARARVAASATQAGDQFILFGFNGTPGSNTHTDVAGYAAFGIPSSFTWIEAPVYASGTSVTTTGYPQFQYKAGAAGALNIDEIQIVKAAPTLADASRLATRAFYSYGDFDAAADTTGWGQEVYNSGTQFAGISQSNGQLVVDFTGAGSGTAQRGIKWTASNAVPSAVYTPGATAGREVGVRVTAGLQSGANNGIGIILVAGYGVESSGSSTIASLGSNLVAAAQIGILNAGTVRAVGKATNTFYQFQFGTRSDIAGVVTIDNADYDRDQDDPNYGNGSLFP